MENGQFGSKIKIPNNIRAVFCTEQLEMICRMDFDMFFGILIFDSISPFSIETLL